MIELKNIQTLARDTIAAATLDAVAYFADTDVIAVDGRTKNTEENLLAERGAAVVVHLPTEVKTTDRMPNVSHCDVGFAVSVKLNPKVNAGFAADDQWNLMEMIQVISSALLGYNSGGDANERFETDDEAVSLIVEDEGLQWYLLQFRIRTVLAQTV